MKHALLATVLLVAISAQAQTKGPQGLTPQPNQTDSALTAETRHVFQTIATNTLKAAQQMPESAYTFKPVDGARTFGGLVDHISDVQATLCANINGHKVKTAGQPSSKEELITNLTASASECQNAFDELSTENASVIVQAPAGQVTHLVALLYIITHASEEYGQMSVYLRLNHLKPPTNDDVKGGGAGKAKKP